MTYEILEQNTIWQTADENLAAAISIFCPLIAIDCQNPCKIYFIFGKNSGLNELIGAFYRDELQIEFWQYQNALNIINSKLYDK